MTQFGFGEKFISYVKLAYTDIITYISNNGFLSEPFQPKRGLKQGDPLSSFLYLLIGEVCIRKINSCKGIKGIRILNTEYKASQLADDTTIFLSDEVSIINCISLFKCFERACGLKLNFSKCDILKVGKNRSSYTPNSSYKMKWPTEPIKALGQWVTNDALEMQKLNEKECSDRINKSINKLKGVKCSMKSKVYLINTKKSPK